MATRADYYLDALLWQDRLREAYSSPKGHSVLDRLSEIDLKQGNAHAFDNGEVSLEQVKNTLALGVLPTVTGSPMYLASEVMPLIRAGADSFPKNWTLESSLVFVNAAFVWFAQWFPVEAGSIPLAAMGWTPVWASGVAPVTGQNDVPMETGDKLILVFYGHPDAGKVPLPVTVIPLEVGKPVFEARPGWTLFQKQATLEKLRLFCAFITFINQRLLMRVAHRIPRSQRRRDAKASVPVRGEISVIRLRVIDRHYGLASSKAVDWRRRWLVRGHWRNQWYARSKVHRPVWVLPYIKGPEHKPLLISKEIFSVER